MNLRQPYEQLIADKLRKLPAPDADASWQQMKRLLDNDDDTKAGGGKRPPGKGGGWWRTGIIAIVLLTSLWLYVEKTTVPGASLARNNTVAPSTAKQPAADAANGSSKKIPGNNQTTTIDKNTTLPLSNATTVPGNNKISNTTTGKPAAARNNIPVNNNSVIAAGAGKNINAVAGNHENENLNVKANHSGTINVREHRNDIENTIAGNNKKDTKHNGLSADQSHAEKENAANHIINDNEETRAVTANSATTGTANPSGERTGKMKNWTGKTGDNNMQDDNLIAGHYPPVNQSAPAEERTWFERLNELKVPGTIPSANTSLLTGDSLQSNRNTGNLLNSETKKGVAKAQRDKAIEDETRKEKKSFHLNLSNVFKPFSLHMDAEPRWAAGIALNSGITLNAQNRFNYNMNAKSGTLSDYIPSLYLQFHLNDYVYMQTELNFISPQYTPQLLVYQQSNDVTAQAGISQQKSIYIQKLYYFNLPVSLHYSPINNLYFSAGLQFSSFQSGLASIQEKQYTTLLGPDHSSSINSTVLKFKDDSIAAKLAPNEWRWQAGADYYWNRFTIGLRYNRAFKDLLNVNVAASLPPTTMRNESLIFFMRYNLFESRKKGSTDQKN